LEKPMLEPIAFGDEQLDSDLREIIGPWEHYSIQAASVEPYINRPAEDAPNGVISFSEAAVVIDGRRFRIIGAIPMIEAFAVCKKASLTFPAAVVVAVLGLGLVDVTNRFLENRSPIGRNNGNPIVERRQSIPAETIRSIALKPSVFSPKVALKWQATGARVGLAEPDLNRKLVKYRKADLFETKADRVPVLAHTPSRENVVNYAEITPLAKTPQDLVTMSSQPKQVARNVSEHAQTEGSSDALANNIALAHNRRDSIEALRSLRRQ
jgi:hypothetical protein